MDFKTATDRIATCVTLAEIAGATGVSENLIRRARLDSDSPHYRKPPGNWREVVARLARDRGGEMANLAKELEEAP